MKLVLVVVQIGNYAALVQVFPAKCLLRKACAVIFKTHNDIFAFAVIRSEQFIDGQVTGTREDVSKIILETEYVELFQVFGEQDEAA